MEQLEIKFFWPLTEQIPLDLDFTNCEKPKLNTFSAVSSGITNISLTHSNSNTWTAFHIDADQLVVKTSKKQNIISKFLFKIMGIKVENK